MDAVNTSRLWCLPLVLLVMLLITSCGSAPATGTTPTENLPTQTGDDPVKVAAAAPDVAASDKSRQTTPDVPEAELDQLVSGNSTFAFDVYQALREEDGNLFYSPYSISLALAMTYAGAQDDTAQQMADTLHFTLPPEQLHPAFNALDLELTARNDEDQEPAEGEPTPFQLNVANALWGQQGYDFLPAFLDTLAEHYGADMRLLDFQNAPEESRTTINDWISEQTEEKIVNLIPEGSIDPLARLILTNAIYFNAAWVHQFEEQATSDEMFTLLDGSEVSVPLMAQAESFRYAEGEGYQAVELPYAGNTAMVVLLPAEGTFASFEETLNATEVQRIVDSMARNDVILKLPKFDLPGATFSLKSVLTTLGMPDAFAPGASNFAGMDGTRELYIDDVVHQATITVDEAGTEAAAATAVMIGVTSAEIEPPTPVDMTVDRPFVFMIRDTQTGAILFMGRVVSP